jgi:hypothetical protein
VVERWGNAPGQYSVHYVGRRAALGTSGCAHGSDDRALVVDLGDSPKLPQMTLFLDGRGDPYGTKKTANSASQMKALHLVPFVAAVQRGAEALQVLSFAAGAKEKPATLCAQFTVPSAAEVWEGDAMIDPGTPERPTTLSGGAPIFIRIGDAVAAVRFLLAQGVDGKPAPITYVDDELGLPARRLTIALSPGPPSGRGTVVAWVRVADGLDRKAFDSFRTRVSALRGSAKIEGDRVLTASGDGLRIEADLDRGVRMALEGGEPDLLLGVDGRDIGRDQMAAAGLPP